MGRGRYRERLGLGDRLRLERKRRGLRQKDAARQIGVSRKTLALVEVDHIPSRATRAKMIAWMAAKPAPARPAGAGSRERSPGGPGGRRKARRLRVLARLAVRRRAERAHRRGAEGGKPNGKKDGKAK